MKKTFAVTKKNFGPQKFLLFPAISSANKFVFHSAKRPRFNVNIIIIMLTIKNGGVFYGGKTKS